MALGDGRSVVVVAVAAVVIGVGWAGCGDDGHGLGNQNDGGTQDASVIDIDQDQDGYPASQDCDDSDPAIYPGVTRPCQSDCDTGTEICLLLGTWNTCTARTDCDCDTPGATRIIDCGNCGQASQECGLDLRWSTSGDCMNEKECPPGAVDNDPQACLPFCGTGTRLCSNQCEWGEWDGCTGECAPGTQRTNQDGCADAWTRNVEDCSAQCGWTTTQACTPDCTIIGRTGTTDFSDEVCIAGGISYMGYGTTGYNSPLHLVALSPYYIDKYEATVARYRACVDAGVCTIPGRVWETTCSYETDDASNLPVNNVTHAQAAAFCQWDGGRSLPTEAQWEKAARGPDPSMIRNPWGDTMATCAEAPSRIDCVPSSLPSPVGSHPAGASWYGVEDLGGNVMEHVQEYYYLYQDTGTVPLDPVGPLTGLDMLFRGKAYYGSLSDIDYSAVQRDWMAADWFQFGLGFRCARRGY